MKKQICPHCYQTFKLPSFKFGSHIRHCKLNPDHLEINKKISSTKQKKKIEYKINCLKCNTPFTLILTPNRFKSGKYRKHCSRTCANGRIQTLEANIKRSEKLKGKNSKPLESRQCVICSKDFFVKSSSSKQTCGQRKCKGQLLSKNLKGKNVGTKNGMFGKSPFTRKSKYKWGYYFSSRFNKKYFYRSSFELLAIKKLEKDITVTNIIYEGIKIPYRKNTRSTVPDFIVDYKNGTRKIIEVKPSPLLTKWNNSEKIKAIEKYCRKNNLLFSIWTEKDLCINN